MICYSVFLHRPMSSSCSPSRPLYFSSDEMKIDVFWSPQPKLTPTQPPISTLSIWSQNSLAVSLLPASPAPWLLSPVPNLWCMQKINWFVVATEWLLMFLFVFWSYEKSLWGIKYSTTVTITTHDFEWLWIFFLICPRWTKAQDAQV